MATHLANAGRQLAIRTLLTQSLVALIVTALFAIFSGHHAALSAFCGGLICLIPGGVFALLAFRYSGASKNELVVRSFSQGSKFKLILTIILFVVAFKGLEASPLPLFGSFVITMATQWVVMFALRRNS